MFDGVVCAWLAEGYGSQCITRLFISCECKPWCAAAKLQVQLMQKPEANHCVIQPSQRTEERNMPFLIPVLVGIPVIFGGGYMIYHFVH
jgi:hypothetical protein